MQDAPDGTLTGTVVNYTPVHHLRDAMTREMFRPANHDTDHFLLTTMVGSYPQPEWLDRVRELAAEDDSVSVERAHDDACKAAISDQRRAGLDVVTDGEMRREGMVEYFAGFVNNYDIDAGGGSGWNQEMPTVVDTVSSDGPWVVDDYGFASDVADRPVKTTITGPFTLASFSSLEAYDGVEELAYDFADLVAAEAGRLAEAGAPWIQVDEPALGMSPHEDIARECLSRIDAEVPEDVRFGVHICSGNYMDLVPTLFEFPVDEVDLEFASDDADDPAEVFDGADYDFDVGFGVVNTQSKDVDPVASIRKNVEAALEVVPPDRLTLTPDCGLKPLSRAAAQGKIRNLAAAAREVEVALDDGEIAAIEGSA
jgi:5-methyltetrahydropteroyltriglutamate--homocysteine methyltransferase